MRIPYLSNIRTSKPKDCFLEAWLPNLGRKRKSQFKISIGLASMILGANAINANSVLAQSTVAPEAASETAEQIDSPVVLNVEETATLEDNAALDIPDRVIIESFQVVGSSVFTEAELASVLKEWTGRPLSLSELYQARSAITSLYTGRGYVNSGAYIPPQKLVSRRNVQSDISTVNTLEIAVLEGTLEGINISGTDHLNQRYIRSRIEKGAGTPLNVEDLLETLQMLRINPLIKNVSAELSAGISPGSSLLDVEIEEADPFKITTRFDNKRSPSVGSNRRGVGFVHSNLLGFGDKIAFDYTNTEGSDSIDLSYAVPFNSLNGTLSFSYGTSDNEIIEDPFTPLDIQSESEYFELGLRQPLVSSPTEEFAMGLNFSFQESKTQLLDTPFPLSIGASEDGETRVSALRFFQEYINRSDVEVFALRSSFNFGIDVFGATQNPDGIPDSAFFAWRGQSQWVRRLDEDFLFLLRGDVQLSSSELLPLEQFRLGGTDSVRGYRQDFALGDNGLFASAEMRIPLLRFRSINGVVQLTPFVDLGTIWNSDTDIDSDFLAAIGLGLNFSAGNGFNARLDWGIPLVDSEQRGDSLQENGVYFTLNWNFL